MKNRFERQKDIYSFLLYYDYYQNKKLLRIYDCFILNINQLLTE